RGFGCERVVGGGCVGAVDDLDVVAFVFGHQGITGDTVEDRVHDRPLRCGCLPAAFGFVARQLDGAAAADVHVECVVLGIDPRPRDRTGLRNAAQCAAAVGKVHGGLAKSFGAGPAAGEVGRRSGAADQEDPDVFVATFDRVRRAPADVV